MTTRGTYCGTLVRNLNNRGAENRHPLRKRNLAEPFPTHFTENSKCMINFSKSEICRFRRFRPNPLFLHLDEMCGERFRRFRSTRIPPFAGRPMPRCNSLQWTLSNHPKESRK